MLLAAISCGYLFSFRLTIKEDFYSFVKEAWPTSVSSESYSGRGSGDGELIASGDSQGFVILWDSFTGSLLRRMSYKATETILDLYFIKNNKYVCARGRNMNVLIAYSVNKGVAVSVLSFTSSITTSSASSIGRTRDAQALDNDTVLCGLADGTVNFVKICEVQVQEESIAEKVVTKKEVAENKEVHIGKRSSHSSLIL